MKLRFFRVFGAIALAVLPLAVTEAPGKPKPGAGLQGQPLASAPQVHVYATKAGRDLRAFVFSPSPVPDEGVPRPAIVIFHGGGWAGGSPDNTFDRGRHFASLGMVAISAEYRLSDQKDITPLEAMEDARDIIRWVRTNSARLGVRPDKIAAYGSSAGAHLAASAAIFGDSRPGSNVSAVPDAMILVSPAVEVTNDGWLARLLMKRTSVASISPAEHIRPGLPPALVLEGNLDTVTPLLGVATFCKRMRAAGNKCELVVYPDVGHVFTPQGIPDNETPQPDPATWEKALKKGDEFLKELGFLK